MHISNKEYLLALVFIFKFFLNCKFCSYRRAKLCLVLSWKILLWSSLFQKYKGVQNNLTSLELKQAYSSVLQRRARKGGFFVLKKKKKMLDPTSSVRRGGWWCQQMQDSILCARSESCKAHSYAHPWIIIHSSQPAIHYYTTVLQNIK